MIPELTSLTNTGAKPDAKDVAAKVQGMFTEIMLKAMEDSVEAEDGLFGKSLSSDIYRGMLREHLANAMLPGMNSPLEGLLNNSLSKAETESETPRVEPAPVQSAPTSRNQPASGALELPVNGVV